MSNHESHEEDELHEEEQSREPGRGGPWSLLFLPSRHSSPSCHSWLTAARRVAEPSALWAAGADAIAVILLLDAFIRLLPGRSSLAFVFFHVPAWLPLAPAVPAAIAAGVLLRVRPVVKGAIVLAFCNALAYLALLRTGRLTGSPLPFSYVVALALVPALFVRRRAPLAGVAVAAAGLLLAHVLTFGATDYRRPADAIVVFGAKAQPDGAPSQVLLDRTMTAVALWRAGYAPRLIFSGGHNEPDVMARLAREGGVPASAIVLDRGGLNTAATMGFLRRLSAEGAGGGRPRFLAVSNDFHNARIRLLAERLGLDCRTVPAHEPVGLTWRPYFIARECAALPVYYLTRRREP